MVKSVKAMIAEFGYHTFQATVKPPGAAKGAHYPCRVCGRSSKARIHHREVGDVVGPNVPDVRATSTQDEVVVTCPTCLGTGTFHLPLKALLKLVAKARS